MFVWLLAAFVASHILLAASPVRARLADALGEKGFQGLYSLISLALLGGAIWIYRGLAPEIIWVAPPWAWLPSSVLMLAASILFAGSLTPANRALAGAPQTGAPPSGVMRITRHPMMWSFAIWALVHATLSGSLPTVILAIGISVLALAGAAHQDGRKRRTPGETWARYEAQTSFFPLGAQVAGRQPWSAIWPGPVPVIMGGLLWAVLTFLHPILLGAPAVPPWGVMR
jgi:uncharacterized membrane protein